MANVEFSVTSQELVRMAEETEHSILELKEEYQELKNIMSGTIGYWSGEGGDSCRKMFDERRCEIEDILDRMQKHPRHLLEMAGIYKEAEEQLVQEHDRLPSVPLGGGGSGGGGGRSF